MSREWDSSGHCVHQHHEKSKGLWVVFILTTGYMFAEAIGGWWSGSLALMADAGHMAIDSAAIALALFSKWIAKKPADDRRTFGFLRAEILGALINGSALIVVALGVFYEAWQRFHLDQTIRGEWMTGIAVGGLLINLIGARLIHDHSKEDLNVRSVWLHLMGDLLGSVTAIIAGLLVWKFSWYWTDSVTSIFIAGLILYGAWKLVSECVDVLLEAVPKGMNIGEIRSAISATEGVKGVHDLHLWTVTSGVPSLSVHITQKDGSDVKILLETLSKLLKNQFRIEHVTIQIEPHGFVHEESGEVCRLGS